MIELVTELDDFPCTTGLKEKSSASVSEALSKLADFSVGAGPWGLFSSISGVRVGSQSRGGHLLSGSRIMKTVIFGYAVVVSYK